MNGATPESPSRRPPRPPSTNGTMSSATASATRTMRDSRNSGSSGPSKPLPNIQDLVAKAERRIEDSRQTADVNKMLSTAELSLKQSRFFADIKKIDQAYLEYLVGAQIVLSVIPNSKDKSADFSYSSKTTKYRELINLVNTEQQTFASIRDAIKADNERNSMKPTPAVQQKTNGASIPSGSAQANNTFPQNSQRDSVASTLSPGRPMPQGPRPQLDHTRSQSFQAQSASLHGVTADSGLAERFAKLRMGATAGEPRPLSMSNSGVLPAGKSPRRDGPSLHMSSDADRSYADDANGARAHPLQIDTDLKQDFPKAPSPTYTPIRSMQSPTAIAPPRSSRASVQLHSRAPSTASSTSASAQTPSTSRPLISKHSAKRSDEVDVSKSAQGRPKSIHRPMETEIDAQKLFDYIQTYSILLVDVRSREEYDAGHIFASTVICIEPTALRPNMSADELHEALVLSPQDEQDFFEHRDLFDLVVYYDQSSSAASKARGRNPALLYLQESLYEYNQEKPLHFPPILLDGGLDAWVDMVGNQSLKTSNTAHKPPVIKARSNSRAYASSKIDAGKRKHREYNPLDPEEEKKWRERARSESFVLDQQPQRQPPVDEHDSYDINDFAKRYPDVSIIDQKQNEQPQEPSRVPDYPTPARPSQAPPPPPPPTRRQPPPPPTIPSRPPPAIARPSYSGVSERSSSQQNVSQRPKTLAPYIPPRLKRVPRVGLHNFGATCYMNSTIQCLSATIDLTAIFLDGAFKRDIQPENWKGSKGLMPELYCVLLRNLWETNDVDTIRPTNFRKFCARLNKEWGTDRQQDAKEFLDFLLDLLHEDLNVNWKHNPLRPLTGDEEARRERMHPLVASKVEWDRYIHRDKSRLTELFAGQHISRLQCTTCHNTSTTYETFYSISVEIPQLSRPVTIYDCLKSYCQAERMSGDEAWKCPHCKKEREVIKRITITRVPAFLVIHFKRFSASRTERARKMHTAVEFPLKGLELDSFVLPAATDQEKDVVATGYGGRDPAPASMTPPYRYDAYAVTRHLGQTMASGHYIGLVKDRARGVWREFNDERVTDFRPEDLSPSKRLQNEQAYIVFYQRVQTA